jgi:hypothetical protein
MILTMPKLDGRVREHAGWPPAGWRQAPLGASLESALFWMLARRAANRRALPHPVSGSEGNA